MSGAGISLLETLARVRGPWRGLQFGDLGNPRPIAQPLPPDREQALRDRLTPVLTQLNAKRDAAFRQAENDLRLKAGGAALAGLVLGWTMGGPLVALALMVLGAGFVILLLAGKVQEAPRAAAKHAILKVMAPVLHRLSSVAPGSRAAALPVGRIEGWRLFGPIHRIEVDDRLTGQRDGYDVAASRLGLQFGNRGNRNAEAGAGLCFIVAEITAPDAPDDLTDAITIVVAQDAAAQSLDAPRLTHRLAVSPTGDADFDARYRVYGDAGPLGPAARAAFAELEKVTRANPTATLELPAGTGLRPWAVIRPGRLVVLTPLALFNGALEPPLMPQPLTADALIPAFAADLAILDDHLTAALHLMKGFSR
ncbi:hypothetical protein [Szabonella alba]|uniref:DUF3137 domain-containing protein n=1 Tax=Szabonella alba TaxID=2804194 RepID=A0A8K0V7G0_9RHOB|nr:hypothetical protein [Szabonella alba]MBL4916763.1 hypothetical protein [Szabonella alba]